MRFKLRTKLLILSLGLFALPWLGYRYISDIQSFLLEGQEQAQLLTTQAIATALQDRPDLLSVQPERLPTTKQTLLYSYPTDTHVLADGYSEEWEEANPPIQFGPAENADNLDPLAMKLQFLQRSNQLYILIQISDRYTVYRHPGYQHLDTSDQIRLTIDNHHYVVTSEAIGKIKVIGTNSRWRQAIDNPEAASIKGGWIETDGGYQVELQMPLNMLSVARKFDITVMDIDDPIERTVRETISTSREQGTRLLVHSPELQLLIKGLKRADRHVWILDQHRQIRAVSNTSDAASNLLERHRAVIERALSGLPAVTRYRGEKNDYILAAQPITSKNNTPLGVAVVEVATDDILNLQRITLLKSAAATALVLVILIAGLLFFSYRLTTRIRRLQRETKDCLDKQGRIVKTALLSEQSGNDELSELGRDMSNLVSRLHQYTSFLERMPRTLKHELSNPLNTISTSLEIIREDALNNQTPYLESAERGVSRLTMIITSLTEAASLEEALRDEKLTQLDLQQFLHQYGNQFQHPRSITKMILDLPDHPAWIHGNGHRLEQLLDKLLDNAVDFSPQDKPLGLKLYLDQNNWVLEFENHGKAIPAEIQASLFDSLVSLRKQKNSNDEQDCHMGIGLFVVKIIATSHNASIEALNTEVGVKFRIGFPAISAKND